MEAEGVAHGIRPRGTETGAGSVGGSERMVEALRTSAGDVAGASGDDEDVAEDTARSREVTSGPKRGCTVQLM